MASLDGRRIPLRRLGPGLHEAPGGLPKGLYLIRAGGGAQVIRILP